MSAGDRRAKDGREEEEQQEKEEQKNKRAKKQEEVRPTLQPAPWSRGRGRNTLGET